MPTLLDFRRRIRSVKNTQQITRAMKFVAAAKLRRLQEGVFQARPYSRQILKVLKSAVARIESPQHPLLARREEKKILVLVFSGDKGLCGAFNTNVLKRALEFFREKEGAEIEIVAVGKKCRDALKKRRFPVVQDFINVTAKPDYTLARTIADGVSERYSAGEVDAVYCVYNEFKSVLAQRLVVEKVLPIDPEMLREGRMPGREELEHGHGAAAGSTPVEVDYIYEQPAAEILGILLPRYVQTQIYHVLLESAAAFNAAQMTAMDAATKNAAELIDAVTLHMNKVRQAGITREIIEVVSGASSTA
jgi:F-type H+-transporting ATPase subunit gamma